MFFNTFVGIQMNVNGDNHIKCDNIYDLQLGFRNEISKGFGKKFMTEFKFDLSS